MAWLCYGASQQMERIWPTVLCSLYALIVQSGCSGQVKAEDAAIDVAAAAGCLAGNGLVAPLSTGMNSSEVSVLWARNGPHEASCVQLPQSHTEVSNAT